MLFTSRVERTISAAHHNGPPDSKCFLNHGHDWLIVVYFEYTEDDLDEWGWGPDFGKVKHIIDLYDHKDLNEMLDVPPSAERFALALYVRIASNIGFNPTSIEVHEGNGNAVSLVP